MTSISALDARGTAAALEDAVRRRRSVEVEDLLLVLQWADLHSADPRDNRDGHAMPPGSDRLTSLAGDGTPGVRELPLVELGVARGVHTLAARAVTADALDLRHRLPHTFTRVLDLDAEVWVARKVASMTRHLSAETVGIVDTAVADAIAGQSPARVLELAAAKIIEADEAAHRAKIDTELRRRYVGLSRIDDTGLRTVIARVTAGDAHTIDQLVDRVADLLAPRPEYSECTGDEVRAEAFALLGRPDDLAALLHPDDAPPARDSRPRAIVYVHLSEAALDGFAGVSRVEGLGPHTMGQLRRLLATRDVTVKPIIDLNEQVSVNAYEHPTWLAERIHLAHPGDQFPHATRMSRRTDLDHLDRFVTPDKGGPPGQTGTTGTRPISRTPHRAKTHLGYRATALDWGAVLWRTPHGVHRIVDHTGTRVIDEAEARAHTSGDALDRSLARLWHQHATARLSVS